MTHDIAKHFLELTPDRRRIKKMQYEKLIDIMEGRLTHFTRRSGEKVPYHKMPWMLPHYKHGLEILTNVMQELGEI